MPFLSLPYILQLLLIIHVFRNNKERFWIYILLFLPGVGAIAYLVVEVLPDLGRSRGARVAQSAVVDLVAPNKNLNDLEQRAKFSPTVKNLRLLADEYSRRKRYDEAIQLYRKCLEGPFSDDEEVLMNLAVALFESGELDEADTVLQKLEETAGSLVRPGALLLHARTLEKKGDADGALDRFAAAAQAGSGLEHRYWHANYLLRTGESREAFELFEAMVQEYRMMPGFSKRDNRVWVQKIEHDMKR